MKETLKLLYFRTSEKLEKAIIKDAKKNFRKNHAETVRSRLAERYNIKIEPRLSMGNKEIVKKTNLRATRVEKEIFDAVTNDAKIIYEGNVSQTIRIGLMELYRKKGIIK
jgi:hypothetical protein